MKITEEVRLDGGNYQEMVFRTPLIRQNRRRRAIRENNSSENGVILYIRADCEDHLGNVGYILPRYFLNSSQETVSIL